MSGWQDSPGLNAHLPNSEAHINANCEEEPRESGSGPGVTGIMLPPVDSHSVPIEWSEEFSIGIPVIDTQHKRLFELVEDLRVAVMDGDKPAVVAKVLKGLVGYCGEHFECEEMLMQVVKYPVYKSHRGIHIQFTDTAIRWMDEFQAGKLQSVTVLDALVEWLTAHIKDKDTKIAAHCATKHIFCANFVTMSDIAAALGDPSKSQSFISRAIARLPVSAGISLIALPCCAYLTWLTFWLSTSALTIALACVGVAFSLWTYGAIMFYVHHQLKSQTRGLRLAHATQLASNMLANEIAQRVATMNLDDGLDELFANEASPLVRVLQEIVEHLRMYLPYIPESVLALVRGESAGGDEEEEEEALADDDLKEEQDLQGMEDELGLGTGRSRGTNQSRPSTANRGAVTTRSITKGPSEGEMQVIYLEGAPPKLPGTISSSDIKNDNDDHHSSGVPSPSHVRHVTSKGSSNSSSRVGSPGRRSSACSVGSTKSRTHTIVSSGRAGKSAVKAKSLLDKWLQKKHVSVMTADITGFHDYVNRVGVTNNNMAAVLEMHAAYVGVVEETSKATKGMVIFTSGDRVMVAWNAATACGNHGSMACKAALLIRDVVSKRKEFTGMTVKMGISSGAAQVGNMGSKSRLSFSIVGAVTVLTSMLVKLNGVLATEVLVSSHTWRDVKEFYVARIVALLDTTPRTTQLSLASPRLVHVTISSPVHALKTATTMSPRTSSFGSGPHLDSEDVAELAADSAIKLAHTHFLPQPPVSSIPSMPPRSTTTSSVGLASGLAYALELKQSRASTTGAGEGEWMYVLQDASDHDPYAAYHDAVNQLFFGAQDKGHALLKEYVVDHDGDVVARDLLDTFEAKAATATATTTTHPHHGHNGAPSGSLTSRGSVGGRDRVSLAWSHGWVHP